jgi:hypothetical protein
MAGELFFDRSDQAALITPDALCVRFHQSGFPAARLRQGDEGTDLLLGDKLELLLSVEDGFVSGVVMDMTFVDKPGERRARLAAELLESMGWVCDD